MILVFAQLGRLFTPCADSSEGRRPELHGHVRVYDKLFCSLYSHLSRSTDAQDLGAGLAALSVHGLFTSPYLRIPPKLKRSTDRIPGTIFPEEGQRCHQDLVHGWSTKQS